LADDFRRVPFAGCVCDETYHGTIDADFFCDDNTYAPKTDRGAEMARIDIILDWIYGAALGREFGLLFFIVRPDLLSFEAFQRPPGDDLVSLAAVEFVWGDKFSVRE
jgi:hypothetical protein